MNEENEKKSLKYNYLLNMIRTICAMVFPLITFAYASRILSVSGIGRVDFCRSIVSYFTLFASLGITTYGIREGAKVRDNKHTLSKLAQELFTINLFTTILVYIIFVFSLQYVEKFYQYQKLMLICGLAIGFTSLGMEWLYGALEEYEYITFRSIIFQIISIILLFVFVKDRNDYYKYAAIIVFSSVGSNVCNFIHSRKSIYWFEKGRLNLIKHFKPILIFFSNSLAGNIYVTLDTSMIGLLSTEYSVGLYSASIKMNRVSISIITALSAILLPRLSYYVEQGDYKKYNSILKKAIECSVMLALPICAGLFLLSKEVLVLFSGKDFIAAASCSKLLSIIIIFIPVSTILSGQILIPFKKEKYLLFGSLVGAGINLCANYFLIPRYDHIGAAIGTILSEGSVVVISLYYANQTFNLKYAINNLWHYAISTIIMIIVIVPLGFLSFSNLIKCFVLGIVGAMVYGICLYGLKDEMFIYILESLKRK